MLRFGQLFFLFFLPLYLNAIPNATTPTEISKQHNSSELSNESLPEISDWIVRQVELELGHFQKGELSKNRIAELASNPIYNDYCFVKISIKNNQVYVSHRTDPRVPHFSRAYRIKDALEAILELYSLPDMDFLFAVHDALDAYPIRDFGVPVFVQAKHKDIIAQILIPDFEALSGGYQVLKTQDIVRDNLTPWELRKSQLIWRGSTAQWPPKGQGFSWRLEDSHCLSRVKLCGFSEQFPELIDAKFTLYYVGGEPDIYLQRFKGDFIPYEDQLNYKYNIMIDGYTCSFSASGWRFFSNSLIFKEDSDNIQWYYNELKPYIHYIPVKQGLSDLIEKIRWAREHDEEAQSIAKQAREFACSHITKEASSLYLYYTLLAYSKLNWVD